MSLLDFTFDPDMHLYQTPGHYVLSTSDVIDLNGLSDMSQIPINTLRYACHRGKVIHKAIESYEQGQDWQDEEVAQYMNYLDGWFAFRDEHDIQIVGSHETPYVYLHDGTEQAIGATIDLRFLYQGDLYVADLKTIHPLYGKALQQKQLAWRLQTQSYLEVTAMDEPFVKLWVSEKAQSMKRCVIHLHPDADKKAKRPYKVYPLDGDDMLLWDGAVRLAMEKVKAGILPSRRDVSVQAALEASLAHEEANA